MRTNSVFVSGKRVLVAYVMLPMPPTAQSSGTYVHGFRNMGTGTNGSSCSMSPRHTLILVMILDAKKPYDTCDDVYTRSKRPM